MRSSDVFQQSRRILRDRKLALSSTLPLALGIATVTLVYAAFHASLLRPLPYHNPEQLVAIVATSPSRSIASNRASEGDFRDWQQRSRTLSQVEAHGRAMAVVGGQGEPEEVPIARVSVGLFKLLGVRPLVGRDFVEGDQIDGRDRVVLVSYGFWVRRFGADPGLVGRNLLINDSPYLVIGVLPESFRYPGHGIKAAWSSFDLWSPMVLNATQLVRERRGMEVVGRLRPGVSLVDAQHELQLLAQQLATEHPETNAGWSADVVPLLDALTAAHRSTLIPALVSALALLLLATANLCFLILSRCRDQVDVLALQMALGASRRDLVTLRLAECLWLTLPGGFLGALLARLCYLWMERANPLGLPRLQEVDSTVLVVAVASLTALLAGCIVGLLAATRGLQQGARGGLRRGRLGGTSGGPTTRSAGLLVLAETSVCFTLLVTTLLLLASFSRQASGDLGFSADRALLVSISLPTNRYRQEHQQQSFFHQLLLDLCSIPPVTACGLSSSVPMHTPSLNLELPLRLERNIYPDGAAQPRAWVRLVSPGYFRALGVPLLAGRDFTGDDSRNGAPVAVVNRTAQRLFWPSGLPADAKLALDYRGEQEHRVIGMVGDIRFAGPTHEPVAEVYLPFWRYPLSYSTVILRSRVDPLQLITHVKQRVSSLDPRQPMHLTTLAEDWRQALDLPRSTLALTGTLTALAAALTALGIYSVVSYQVRLRRSQFSIRLALGATPSQLVLALAKLSLALSAMATFCGVVLGLLLQPFLGSLVATPKLPLAAALLGAALLTHGVVLLGTWLPARTVARAEIASPLRLG
ncbi:MAG: ABC transporter permease [Thermoanaerobaculia bacterium]